MLQRRAHTRTHPYTHAITCARDESQRHESRGPKGSCPSTQNPILLGPFSCAPTARTIRGTKGAVQAEAEALNGQFDYANAGQPYLPAAGPDCPRANVNRPRQA